MSKKDLLAAGALRTGTVEINGVSYAIREASSAVIDKSMKLYQSDGAATANAYTVCNCVLDDNGKRLFQDSDFEDVKAMSPAVVTKIATAIGQLDDGDAAKN